jgi:hypothetical protein
MIIKSIKVIRPNTETDFYDFSLEFVSHRLENYINTGMLSIGTVMSDDGLSKTSTFIFSNQTAKNKYSLDPIVVEELRRRNIYNNSNGITTISNSISTYQEVA